MRIAVSSDERTGVASALLEQLRDRGHETVAHGALAAGEREDWAWASEAAARDVALALEPVHDLVGDLAAVAQRDDRVVLGLEHRPDGLLVLARPILIVFIAVALPGA